MPLQLNVTMEEDDLIFIRIIRSKQGALSIRYKGHIYKGQLVKIMTLTKQFIRDASLVASSLNLTISLIKDTEYARNARLGVGRGGGIR